MRIYAFEGIRYTPRAGDAGELAAPPYDQINTEAARERYQSKSPHQFVHLSRPVPGEEGDPYRHAAALHQRWSAEGAIAREERPALYPYAIELAGGGRRLGLCALVGLAGPEEIRPHERTLDKPLADRLALLEAMRVDLEPALLVSEDGGRLDALLREDVERGTPLVRHRDEDGHGHVLYKVEDPGRIARYQEVLSVTGAIADGHHRYKVAQRFAERHGAEPGTAPAAKLSVITSLESPALSIQPIHRGLKERIDLSTLAGVPRAHQVFRGSGGQSIAAAVAAATQPALGVWVGGHDPEVWVLDPTTVPDVRSTGVPQLSVELLHQTILGAVGLSEESWTDGTVAYRANPDDLWEQVASGELGTGFWLPPMEAAAFAQAIAGGQVLPPKSTRFLPKVMSGLVWAEHGTRLA